MRPCCSHNDYLFLFLTAAATLAPHPCSDLPRWHRAGTSSCASSSPAQCPGTGSELLPTAGAWERSPPPTGAQIWIFPFGKSCTASHSAQGCGFRNSPSPHLVFTAIFNCLCLFLPSACPPPACTHCTAQLTLLCRLQLQQSTSSGHPITFPCPSRGAPATLGTKSPPLQWHIPQGQVPLSPLPVTNDPIQCHTSTNQANAPRESTKTQDRENMTGRNISCPIKHLLPYSHLGKPSSRAGSAHTLSHATLMQFSTEMPPFLCSLL